MSMSSWFVKLRTCRRPIVRIFGFPYAGGNGYTFLDLAKTLPEGVEFFGIQAPGRLQRFDEEPLKCVVTISDILVDEITDWLDIPRITLAYSNGALIAFEMERKLQSSGDQNLEHMIICARKAPHLPDRRTPFCELSYRERIEVLDSFSLTPKRILYNASEMAELMPLIEADFSLSDNYECLVEPKLNTNASIFAGAMDDYCTLDEVWAWNTLINGSVDCVEFDTGHFFKYSERDRFISEVISVIDRNMMALSVGSKPLR